ncbi:twin transmembrane helix small protein [Roseibium aggregatum]|uniref:Twin transmembrane helix small protein n=1 Tax=Roseibium aggregatum TaxID=187304 RepID=A0A926NZF4_9HYPH|nr:twin transmembrane helix small protein [Roseibium aggregatum]MBD1546455.1 twin transmembrane helix small protein [Roseibium aggregatum]
METVYHALVPVGLAAVTLVLLLGIWNMLRGGPGNRSQMLMRWRVGLQFIVIVVIMTGIYFFGTPS